MWVALVDLIASFWFIVAFFVATMTIAVAKDSLGWGVVLGLLFLCGLQWGTDVAPLTWAWFHPIQTVLLFFSWMGIGGVWSVFRWWRFLAKEAREARERADTNPTRPRASYYTEEIMLAILIWPISIGLYIFEEPVIRTVRFVYDLLTATYDRISVRMWRQFTPPPTTTKTL